MRRLADLTINEFLALLMATYLAGGIMLWFINRMMEELCELIDSLLAAMKEIVQHYYHHYRRRPGMSDQPVEDGLHDCHRFFLN